MRSIDSFTIQKPRMFPVIVAVDRSGSMSENGKIQAVNLALRNFIESLKEESNERAEIHLAVFSFGGASSTCDLPLSAVMGQLSISELLAVGATPLGDVFQKVKKLIEDINLIPRRAYRPTLVLISDGQPNDSWEEPMQALIRDGRSSKTFRFSLAIGDDADKAMLGRFVSAPEYLMSGGNARDIRKFFRWVSMSVTARLKSQSPDMQQLPAPIPSDDTLDF